MEEKPTNETVLELIKSVQETNEAIAASFVAAQERNISLAQGVYKHAMEALEGQAQSTRVLMEELGQHVRRQQEVFQRMASQEAFQKIAKESMDRYMNFLRSPMAYYQQALRTAEAATRQSLENFQKASESFQKATQQGLENFQKATRQQP
jgi:hypothetical protein